MKHLKHFKKYFAAFMAFVLSFAMVSQSFAQTVGTAAAGKGSITISNAAKGVEYKLYKLFDATNSATEGASIAYTGTIPVGLTDYFEVDSAGNITAKASAYTEADGVRSLTSAAVTALTTWANSQPDNAAVASATSDGSTLIFEGLDYGYYVVKSSQGTAVSVDSTNPNATIIDKNTTTPVTDLSKTAGATDVNIGDTVTYTVSFGTANYDGTKQIVKYEITDAPAANSLTDITVTSITVGGTAIDTQQFDDDGKLTINWTADGNAGTSLYANGATLVITYTATVADTAAIDGAGNANTVTVKPILDDGTSPDPDQYTYSETIFTYAIAIQKVDQSGNALAGATFQLPFYVKTTAADDGAYIYAGTEAGEGLTNTLTTPDSGLIIVKGVKTGDYSITETVAPDGYNLLTTPVTVTATKTGTTTTNTTTFLDADGNIVDTQTDGTTTVNVSIENLAATPAVVVNKTGAELPSTGGIGTTIFYVGGGLLVTAAVVMFITKRRMASTSNED